MFFYFLKNNFNKNCRAELFCDDIDKSDSDDESMEKQLEIARNYRILPRDAELLMLTKLNQVHLFLSFFFLYYLKLNIFENNILVSTT